MMADLAAIDARARAYAALAANRVGPLLIRHSGYLEPWPLEPWPVYDSLRGRAIWCWTDCDGGQCSYTGRYDPARHGPLCHRVVDYSCPIHRPPPSPQQDQGGES